MNHVHYVNVVHAQPTSPPTARRAQRSEDFLAAAIALVEAEGIEGLTIARLAHSLGLAVGAMYRYFPSKDDLLSALEVRALDDYTRSLVQALAAQPPPRTSVPALARIFFAPRHYHRHLVAHPAVRRLLSIALADPRRLVADAQVEPILLACQRLALVLGGLFADAARAGALPDRPPGERVLVYFACTQGVVQLEKLLLRAGGMPGIDALLDQSTAALLRGFGARAALVTKAARLVKETP